MKKNLSAAARAAVLAGLEIREVRDVDGKIGRMVKFDNGDGFIIAHGPDGSAAVTLLSRGHPGVEFQFPNHVMDELVQAVAGPTRWEEDATDAPLQYCRPCLDGRCRDCKGEDACQCDHVARVVTP